MTRLLQSTTATAVEAHAYSGLTSTFGGPLKVVVNPSPAVFLDLYKRAVQNSLRGLFLENGDVIWWSAVDAIHGQVATELGMKPHEYMDRRLEAFSKHDEPYVDIAIWEAQKIKGFRRMLPSDQITWYGGSFGQVSLKDYEEGLKHNPHLASVVEARIRKLFVTAMPQKASPKAAAVPKAMQSFPKNDYCSLVAMSFALNIPIAKVWTRSHSYWTAAGSKGLPVRDIVRIVMEFGKAAFHVPEYKGKTMSVVMPKLGRGRGSFLVVVPGHVLAVKDGKFVDTMDTGGNVVVLGVLQIKAPDKLVGKFVDGDHKQGGKTYRLPGIYYGDKHVYVRAANGEGVLPLKNVKVRDDEAPAPLREAYEAYRKKFQ